MPCCDGDPGQTTQGHAHHGRDRYLDVLIGEVGHGGDGWAPSGRGGFVVVDFGVGDWAVVIDHGVHQRGAEHRVVAPVTGLPEVAVRFFSPGRRSASRRRVKLPGFFTSTCSNAPGRGGPAGRLQRSTARASAGGVESARQKRGTRLGSCHHTFSTNVAPVTTPERCPAPPRRRGVGRAGVVGVLPRVGVAGQAERQRRHLRSEDDGLTCGHRVVLLSRGVTVGERAVLGRSRYCRGNYRMHFSSHRAGVDAEENP
jgi:hypothetical protein